VAQRVVQALCEQVIASGRTLREVALVDAEVRAALTSDAIEHALGPEHYLGSADTWMDRALEAYRQVASGRGAS
ncbi:MAG TPA: hypothetical protein VGR57_18465, partial [Ktedonobacterales bacterium]|nr:hypothetical protein [Ktedonobacterales bacterium]